MTRRRPAVNVTLPRALRTAYEEASAAHTLPSLGALLERAVRQQLARIDWPAPPPEEHSTRTAAATAARVARGRERRGT